jgi:FkbM family methyltransferase
MTRGIVPTDFSLKDAARKLFRAVGYDVRRYRPYQDHFQRLQLSLQRHNVTVLFDVGANVGQFARAIRKAGYRRHIISFEPLSAAHAKLLVASRHDPLWTIAPRCALAARCGDAEINLAANSQSSSISNMLERHIAGAPEAIYVGKERVTTTTLDCFLDGKPDLEAKSIALKIDTQGYERAVLDGLHKWSNKVKVIMTEMSLAALYEGEPRFAELFRMIEDRGYHCISIEPGFTDPRTYEVLQVDAIFER